MVSHIGIFFTFSCIWCFLGVVSTVDDEDYLYQMPDFVPSKSVCLTTIEDYMGPIRCCVDPVIQRFFDSLTEGFDECYDHTLDMCDVAMCKAIVREQIAEDGSTIIEKVLKDFSDDPQLTENIVNNCTAPELRRFHNPEAYSCDMQRLNQCITIQAVLACKNWNNDKITCSGDEEYVEQCKPFILRNT